MSINISNINHVFFSAFISSAALLIAVSSVDAADLSPARFAVIPAPTGSNELMTDEKEEVGEKACIPTKININIRRSRRMVMITA